MARSIGDLQDIVRAAKAKGASLKATEQPIDTSTAAGKCFLDMLGVFAEFETNIRKERQLEGIAKAKAAGVYIKDDCYSIGVAPGHGVRSQSSEDRQASFALRLEARLPQGRHQDAGDAIRQVIAAARRMIDAVASAACAPPFKSGQLCRQSLVVEQVDEPAVHRREQVTIQVALGLVGRAILDAVHAEAFARPFAGVAIAAHRGDAIISQCVGKLTDDSVRREWRADLAHAIEERALALLVRDGERHAVGAAAARIDEAGIG
jgi:hypothetical protein